MHVTRYDGKSKLGDFIIAGIDVRPQGLVADAELVMKSLPLAPATSKNKISMQSDEISVSSLLTDDESTPSILFASNSPLTPSSSAASLGDCAPRAKIPRLELRPETEKERFAASNVPVMVFESPSTSSDLTSFKNVEKFLVHDFPAAPPQYWSVMRPIRYAALAGNSVKVWTKKAPPAALLSHWDLAIPDFVRPNFISDDSGSFDLLKQVQTNPDMLIHAYLPLEQIPEENHVVSPSVHYHVAGKGAIPEMTVQHAPKHFLDTKTQRPCVAKVTHAMGSLGIFIVKNDDDENELHEFLANTGHPEVVVTEFIDISRNLACHFFVNLNGEMTWFGYSENEKLDSGGWASDSTFCIGKQEEMQELLVPYATDVAKYFLSKGFWGFAGIDVLFDNNGKGYVVDVNPRVTGSMPALMTSIGVFETFNGLGVGKFRKSTKWHYPGSMEELLSFANKWNTANKEKGHVVIYSVYEQGPACTQLNIGAWGKTEEEVDAILALFCKEDTRVGAGRA